MSNRLGQADISDLFEAVFYVIVVVGAVLGGLGKKIREWSGGEGDRTRKDAAAKRTPRSQDRIPTARPRRRPTDPVVFHQPVAPRQAKPARELVAQTDADDDWIVMAHPPPRPPVRAGQTSSGKPFPSTADASRRTGVRRAPSDSEHPRKHRAVRQALPLPDAKKPIPEHQLGKIKVLEKRSEAQERKRPLALEFTRTALRQAVVMNEILGPPLALRSSGREFQPLFP